MDNYKLSISKFFPSSPQLSNKPKTEEPIAKIAVLFTDIVGSTEFFKTYGDTQGKEMLRRHYNIATSVFSRFNGNVIKFIGDSIMASFIDPTDAIKAAIILQQKILINNRKRGGVIPTHVRIGIHYGEVIVEKDDIYGDVVNVASKLTNIAKGDEIYISSAVYDQVKGMGTAFFEVLPLLEKKNIPEDLVVLKVVWDENIAIDPEEDAVIFINPITAKIETDYYQILDSLIVSEYKKISDKIKKTKILSDKSYLLYLDEPTYSMDLVKKIIDMFFENIEKKDSLRFPLLQIIIATSKNFPESEEIPPWLKDCLWDISPGYIYISEDIYFRLEISENEPLQKGSYGHDKRKFYIYAYPSQGEETLVGIFPYSYALLTGPFRPCFYCGSKKHREKECPSKDLPDYTCSAERLGYYPIDKINNLFLRMILNQKPDNKSEENELSPISHIARESLYEVTRIYQLRFFRCIWNTDSTNWSFIREHKSNTEGGLIWLSQDSIRISDLDKAENLLEKAKEESHDNFRLYCVYGYLRIEKEDIESAEDYFKKALSYAKHTAHKIFIRLLIARLYFITGRLDDASKIVKEILSTDPFCVDALYMDIKIELNNGKESKALKDLEDLIKGFRCYFIYAFIDYEFFPYRKIIAERLESLFKKAKTKAEELSFVAEEESNKIKDMGDKQTISEIQALLLKIKNAIGQNSYFGYLDAGELAETVIAKCREIFNEKKKKIIAYASEFYKRLEKIKNFLDNYKYKRFSESIRIQTDDCNSKVKKIMESIEPWTSSSIEAIELACRDIEMELEAIEGKVENLVYLKRLIDAFFIFGKWILLSLSSVIIICFIIFPLFAYYFLDIISNRFSLAQSIDMWYYQKIFFKWGSAVSILLSAFVSIKRFIKGEF